MFRDCANLESVSIPSGVIMLGRNVFENCPKLTNVTFAGTMAQWEAIEKENDWNYGMSTNTIHCSDGDFSW